ncbi:MAG TPA: YifB family Mg chelatase-like AAA ATPase [Rectinema sp.]|nr:YifB family Mg chelatase-like AAA ATPase [Rectinema sp.]
MDLYAHEPLGFDGILVHIEADIRNGIPAVEIVGLASTSVREARERARIAVRNAGFEFPQDRILVNLSPADLPKEGSAYDLPIALKILEKSGQIGDLPICAMAMGELTLEGEIRPVRGILPAVRSAASHGIRICILPFENAQEARILKAVQVWPIRHLAESNRILIEIGKGKTPQGDVQEGQFSQGDLPIGQEKQIPPRSPSLWLDLNESRETYSDFRGDERLMRALVIAAAGGHNMFLAGPPGAGKTMAARRFPSILPDLSEQEALDTASIYSLWGSLWTCSGRRPPFRAPHHSASMEGILGGAKPLRPGEVSLAHHGVLFLDECPEFRRDVLQGLREPVERGYVDIVRAGRVLRFPSDFQLIMAANPCPCGNLGMRGKTCICSPEEIRRYWKKLGGPLLDRIDMRIAIQPPKASRLIESRAVDVDLLRDKVKSAREIQNMRFKRTNDGMSKKEKENMGSSRSMMFSEANQILTCNNAHIPAGIVNDICHIAGSAEKAFLSGMANYSLSARAGHSILRLARTIADIDGENEITESAIEEAIEYRQFGDGDAVWPF